MMSSSNNYNTNVFVVWESRGTYALNGPTGATDDDQAKFTKWAAFKSDKEASLATLSPNGALLIVGNDKEANVISTQDGSNVATIRNHLLSAKVSLSNGYLMGWGNPGCDYHARIGSCVDNYNIWSLKGDKVPNLVCSQKMPNLRQSEFSACETVYATLINKAVQFYNVPNFHDVVHKTPNDFKVGNFSMSPQLSENPGQFYVILFLLGVHGGPAFSRLFSYPKFETPIASKTSYQADRTEIKWNKKGNGALVIITTDIDKTEEFFYGKTNKVHYLDVKGSTFSVQTESESNVAHAAEWSPSSTEFCAILGKMPDTHAYLFNTKGDKVLDMGVAPRNTIHFNPQGTILLICAFGNLQSGSSSIDVWEINQHKDLKRALTVMKVPYTTQLVWLNDGLHFITATTTPQMRQMPVEENCFKIWNIAGNCLYKWSATRYNCLFGIIPFISNPVQPFAQGEKLVEELVNKPNQKPNLYVPDHKRKAPLAASAASKLPSAAAPESSLTEEIKIRSVRKNQEITISLSASTDKETNVETLSKRHLHFLTSGAHADITLIVGKDKIPIKAHKLILMFGSSYFEQLLENRKEVLVTNIVEVKELNIGTGAAAESGLLNPATTTGSETTIANQMDCLIIEDVEPDDFDMFLQFLYSKIPPTDINTALPLLMCAKKFNVPSLIEVAENLLKRSLTLESALTIFQQAVHFKYEYLQASALELICKRAYKVLETDKFTDLAEEALGLILQQDELRAYDEMQVFEATIRWAHAECGRQNMDPTNGKYIRSVLESLLKFIRFPLMNASEFPSKVGRLKVLTTEERVDILEAFNSPQSQRFSEFFPTGDRLYYIPETPTQVIQVVLNSLPELATNCTLNHQSDITFKVNKPLWISRIGFSRCHLNTSQWSYEGGLPESEVLLIITLKIKNSNPDDVPALKKSKEIVKVNVTQNYTAAAVEFKPPVRIKAGMWYLITASFNVQGEGKIKYQRFSPAASQVSYQDDQRGSGDGPVTPVYFEFQNNGVNNNGQISEIGYKLDDE